ncbi:MAG: VTT domain-containing protein [Candidatus Aenigmarchaeota archaeon]|nr:VTT domain-containing protein [Candidatus Aenigmarchaeota archaeon]
MLLEAFSSQLLEWIRVFSYPAIFFVSFLGTSTIFLPFPIYLVIFFSRDLGLHPFIVGILAGVGSALGEITGYGIGYGGRKLVKRKIKWLKVAEAWFKRNGFITIFIFALTPLPDDITGIIGGITKYEIKKFFIASILGKTLLCLFISYLGYLTLPYIKDVPLL